MWRDDHGGFANAEGVVMLDTPLVMDHDHATGIVRALLCHPCNIGLGGFKDNPAHLRLATTYLEKYK